MHLTNVAINDGIVENSSVIVGQWSFNKSLNYLAQHPSLFDEKVTIDSLYSELKRVSKRAMAAHHHILAERRN